MERCCLIHDAMNRLEAAWQEFKDAPDSLRRARSVEALYQRLGEKLQVALQPERLPPEIPPVE